MTTEQRLADALAAARDFEASPDLWTRVVYSIEEQRSHRRRVVTTTMAVVSVVALALVAVAGSLESVGSRVRLDWRGLEAIEFLVLSALVVALGPAIRRFGRGFVSDLFVTSPDTGSRLLSLLDVAYFLVFTGYVLVTTRLGASVAYRVVDIGDQVEDALFRVAGLLLAMGVLHGLALMTLPLIALVFNSTRTNTKLPRWLAVVLVIVGLLVGSEVLGGLVAVFGASS